MQDGESDFRDALPSDSDINDLIEWFERDDVLNVIGHIGERAESGEWETFVFDINETDGETTHQISIDSDDLPDGFDWDDFFDWLEDWADENDVDYDNQYAET